MSWTLPDRGLHNTLSPGMVPGASATGAHFPGNVHEYNNNMDNRTIAQELTAHAHALEQTQPHLYRVRAYRRAAEVILGLERPVAEIIAERGCAGLAELPGIGRHLSYTIEHLVRTGEFLTFDEREVDSGRPDCNADPIASVSILAGR